MTKNQMTQEEKQRILTKLQKEFEQGSIDQEIIPYLNKLNSISFIATIESCSGHSGIARVVCPGAPAWPHVIFRSALPVDETINILRELAKREIFDPFLEFVVEFSIIWPRDDTERLYYRIMLNRTRWREQLQNLYEVCLERDSPER